MTPIEAEVPPHGRPRWPWGVIGALSLILSVEQLIDKYENVFTNTAALNWRYTRDSAVSKAPGRSILLLGSSLLKYGLAPKIIESETGRTSYNLAACGGNMAVNYFVLKRALLSGARPDAVLIDCPTEPVIPGKQEEGDDWLKINERCWPELLDVRDTLDLAFASRNPDFVAQTLLSQLLPSYKARFEIRANVLASLQGQPESHSWETELVQRNWDSNRGMHVNPRNPVFEARHAKETVHTPPQPPPPEGWLINQLSVSYGRRFLDLAQAHGIRVLWIVPPIAAFGQEARNRAGRDEHQTRFIREVLANHPEVTIIDGRRSAYPATAFCDTVHLNSTGAATFTSDVSTILRLSLEKPAPHHLWVHLPPYRHLDPGPNSPLEDIVRSGKILKDETRLR